MLNGSDSIISAAFEAMKRFEGSANGIMLNPNDVISARYSEDKAKLTALRGVAVILRYRPQEDWESDCNH